MDIYKFVPGSTGEETPRDHAARQGYVFIAVQMFLDDRQARDLSPELTELYENELTTFLDFCEARGARELTDISCLLIRDYRLALNRCRKPSGVLAARCTLDVFFDWSGYHDLAASWWEEPYLTGGEGRAE